MKNCGKKISAFAGLIPAKRNGYRKTIGFLEAHHYFTVYGQEFLEQKKEENLAGLRHMLSRYQKKHGTDQNAKEVVSPWYKKEYPEKRIETMFKISSGNHQRLSVWLTTKHIS
jgi:hypothetical protein